MDGTGPREHGQCFVRQEGVCGQPLRILPRRYLERRSKPGGSKRFVLGSIDGVVSLAARPGNVSTNEGKERAVAEIHYRTNVRSDRLPEFCRVARRAAYAMLLVS